MADETQPDITSLTVQLLSAFVSNNSFAAEGLPDLIRSTRAALTAAPVVTDETPEDENHKPAVSVRKSLSSPDHIISLIDGKPYKTLKRHLASRGLTPDQYRERYSLPKSYPLVASSYSAARRAVAAKLGLGKRPATVVTPDAAETSSSQPPSSTNSPKVRKTAPKKAAATPAKQQASKVTAADTVSASLPSDTPVAAPAKVVTPKKEGRKRLSIALSQAQDAVAAPADIETPSHVETDTTPGKTARPTKPKIASKSKAATTEKSRSKPVSTAKSAKSTTKAAKQPRSDAPAVLPSEAE